MKTSIIFKSLIFGILAGVFGMILVSAQPSEYGLAITPALLGAGMVLVMVAELSEKESRKYGIFFHTAAALTLLVLALSTGMISGYEYSVWDYYSKDTLETVQVSWTEWLIPFGVYLIRVFIEIGIRLGKKN